MVSSRFHIKDEDRFVLAELASNPSFTRKINRRAGIVLRSAVGHTDHEVASEFQVSLHTVGKWRRRYLEGGVPSLEDGPRSGKPRTIPRDAVAAKIRSTLQIPPPEGARWTVREVAKVIGLPPATTGRIWREFELPVRRQDNIVPAR